MMRLLILTACLIIAVAQGAFINGGDPPATEGPKPKVAFIHGGDPPATEGPQPEDQTKIIVNEEPTEIILNDPAKPKLLKPAEPVKISNPEAMNPLFTANGQKLWEGDMILSEEQVEGLYGPKGTRKAINDLNKRWPNGVIPYRFLPVSEPDRQVILSGLQHWMDNSCVMFYEVDANADLPHLYFNKSDGCYSSVGMVYWLNGQELSIGNGCESMGTVAHEVGHALGFYHEQSRPDRDQYVKILEYNIIKKNLYNFNLQNNVDNYGVEYDLTSLMHYGLDYFTVNGKKTMVPLDPTKEFLIGQRKQLSFKDLKLANIMYKCADRCSNQPNCRNGGFVTHTCQCRCPPEFEGSNCERRAQRAEESCGGRITSPRTLTSPNYPNNYPKDSRCVWVIQAPEGYNIQLTVSDFKLLYRYEGTNECIWDYLEIRVGDNYDGQQYCKEELKNLSMFIPSNKAVLLFKADYDWNKGFSMDIQFV